MKPDEIRASLNRRAVWRSPNKEKAREYIFTGAIFRRGEKGFFYQVELQDLKARSMIYQEISGKRNKKSREVLTKTI